MILLDTKSPHRWVPPWAAGDPAATAYMIRAGSVIERETLEAQLAGEHRAARVYPFQLRAAFNAGVDALIGESDPDGAARLKELAAADAALKDGEALNAEERALLDGAADVLRQHWPAYQALNAQSERREMLAPLLAFRRFCVGIEGGEVAYRRGPDGLVADEVLQAVDPLELRLAGAFAYRLLYGGGEAKNSAPASKSAGDQKTSPSRPRKAAVGSSRASGGKKTRSPRSPRGRSAS